MGTVMLYATLAFAGLMLACMVINIASTAKTEKPSVWATRGLYIFGILAAVANTVRVMFTLQSNKGTMIFASIVVMFCLVYSFYRSEKGVDPAMQQEEQED